MPLQKKTRRAGGTAGLGDNAFPGGTCSSENAPKAAVTQAENNVRLRFLAARLHGLGPKPLYYFLREIEAGAGIRPHLERYAALPADFIAAYGGDRFEPTASLVRGDGQ
jgi:hypothetical protein